MRLVNRTPEEENGISHTRKISLYALLCIVCLLAGMLSAFILIKKESIAAPGMDKLQNVYELLTENWYYGKDIDDLDERLVEQAITGMSTLEEDIHTNYFSLEQAEAFSQVLAGSSVGLGISYYPNEQGNMVIRNVYVNSTADKAGLQPGDVVIQVGDLPTEGTPSEDLISYIKNHDGRETEVKILRNGQEETLTVTPGTFDSTVALQLKDQYGLITLSSFSEHSGKDFADAAARAKRSGASDLIIDLRGNSGGYLSSVRDIASSLLPDDTVIFLEETKDGTRKEIKTTKSYAQLDFDHIYLLQDGSTASASEVLIGALKDNLGAEKVTTIGTQSYGKGTEQVSVPYQDGTSLKYTVAEWLTPNGTSINKVGFTPDVEVKEDDARTVTYREMAEDEVIAADTVADNARAIQTYLAYLGYPADRTDTYFSLQSSAALAQFQSDHGLEPTGNADKATFDTLVDTISYTLNSRLAADDRALNQAIALIQS